MTISVGSTIPDLKVDAWVRDARDARRLALSEFAGGWLVLFFYPRDFTFICPTEIAAFGDLHGDFRAEGAEVLGASTDSFYSHKAWFETDRRLAHVNYPVVADTSHEFTNAFEVLLPDGRALRATFIVSPDGRILHSSVTDLDVGRNVQETLRVLQALKTGELCPVNWTPGQATLTTNQDLVAQAFPFLPASALDSITTTVQRMTIEEGETIIREGDEPDRMFVIAHGEVEVLKRSVEGTEKVLATLSEGQFFGEIGILQETPRTASVRARTKVDLVALEPDAVHSMMTSSEETARDMASVVATRTAPGD